MIPIFLDWDGVVVDSTKLYFDLVQEICLQNNKTLPIRDIDGFRDWYRSDWEQNFYELGFTHSDYLRICEQYPATLDYSRAPYFEGAQELIQELAAEHPLVVLSTAPTRAIEDSLRKSGLLECFESVTGSDDGSTDKEGRLAEHLTRLGCRNGVMVGDTDLDIQAGRANELTTVGVTYGLISEHRVRAAQPDFFVESPTKLAKTVSKAVAKEMSQRANP